MKKILLSVAILSALGVSAVSQAATVGATGTITFQGEINADSCVIHTNGPGSAGGRDLLVAMGSVSANSLGSETQPTVSGGAITALPTDVALTLECGAGTSVELALTPGIASGKGIGVTGGAQGVQIMLTQAGNALDFSTGPVTLNAALNDGVANIDLRAYYTRQAGKGVGDVVPGNAVGTASYVLSYN